jgi:hypothetical protein
MLAIIGGAPDRFGTTAQPVGMHSPGFVAATGDEAKELFYPGYRPQLA